MGGDPHNRQENSADIEKLLLVGHNPGFQNLALELIGKASRPELSRLRAKYPTAGLVVIDFDIAGWSQAEKRAGRLQRFVTPKSLAGN